MIGSAATAFTAYSYSIYFAFVSVRLWNLPTCCLY
jgi:hypothetical protein